MIVPIFLLLIFLCWGSFLNVVGHRLIIQEAPLGRSRCVHCKYHLAWYDMIPLISYILLRGKCRRCHQSISPLYPFIELITAISLLLLYYAIDADYFLVYFLFFSALIITIRTDLESMLISRFVTLALIPFGFLLSCSDHIPIIPLDSLMGIAIGYLGLWLIGTIFYLCTHKQGIGEGDFELLAFIGAFTGMYGVWISLLLGSLLGSIIGISYLSYTGALKRHAQLPFGPFLAGGAMVYVLCEEYITYFLGWNY